MEWPPFSCADSFCSKDQAAYSYESGLQMMISQAKPKPLSVSLLTPLSIRCAQLQAGNFSQPLNSGIGKHSQA